MRGLAPQAPDTPYYDRVEEEEDRAERANALEAEGDAEMRGDVERADRGRWLVYLLVALGLAGILLVGYLLASYLASL